MLNCAYNCSLYSGYAAVPGNAMQHENVSKNIYKLHKKSGCQCISKRVESSPKLKMFSWTFKLSSGRNTAWKRPDCFFVIEAYRYLTLLQFLQSNVVIRGHLENLMRHFSRLLLFQLRRRLNTLCALRTRSSKFFLIEFVQQNQADCAWKIVAT